MDPANALQSSMHMCLHPYGTFWHEAVEPRIYPGDMNDFAVHVLITWPNRIIHWRHGVLLWFCIFRCARDLLFILWWVYLFCVDMWQEQSWQVTPTQWNLSVETTFKLVISETFLGKYFNVTFLVILGASACSSMGVLGYWSRLVHIIWLQTKWQNLQTFGN